MSSDDLHEDDLHELEGDPGATQKHNLGEDPFTVVLPNDEDLPEASASDDTFDHGDPGDDPPTLVVDMDLTDDPEAPTSSDLGPPTRGDLDVIDDDSDDLGGAETVVHDEDDVFVILPEQMDGEIPMVETQVVEDEAFASDFDPTESLDGDTEFDTAEVSATGVDMQFDGDTEYSSGAFGSDRDTEVFDESRIGELSSDMDDDLLIESGAHVADPDERELHDIVGVETDDEYFEDDEYHAAAPRKSRGVLAFAALLAVGAGLYYFYFLDTPVKTSSGTAVVVDSGSQKGGLTGKDGASGGTDGSGGTDASDEVRQVFRDKMVLAYRLGFPAEVADE